MFVIFLLFGVVISGLGYSLVSNLYQINQMNQEKKKLETQLVDLNDEKEILEVDIEKLSDPDYIAKYVREKYLYSKDGELILRMDD
jgi:cell division protein DivIC